MPKGQRAFFKQDQIDKGFQLLSIALKILVRTTELVALNSFSLL
jgi:hypothetical protein